MNIREAQKIIRDNEMPASEAARLLDQVNDSCIHFRSGECGLVDVCCNTEAEDYDSEPF